MITSRADVKEGLLVVVKVEEDYVRGYIKKIISKNNAKKGILVELTNGTQGRVYEIVSKDKLDRENNIEVNKFLSTGKFYSVWDNEERSFMMFYIKKVPTVLIFSDKELANKFYKKIKPTIKDKNTNINVLNKNRTIVENIEHLKPVAVILNGSIRMTYKDFKKREEHFNSLI